MVRHPSTRQLLWCRSLPFGYGLSPLHFCRLTEAVAGVLRVHKDYCGGLAFGSTYGSVLLCR